MRIVYVAIILMILIIAAGCSEKNDGIRSVENVISTSEERSLIDEPQGRESSASESDRASSTIESWDSSEPESGHQLLHTESDLYEQAIP